MLQYFILAAAIAAVLFSLFTLVVAARTKFCGRKWPWILFIPFGCGRVAVNWSTGEMSASFGWIQLLSASAAANLNGPWAVSFSLPIGAILFLTMRNRLKRRPEESVQLWLKGRRGIQPGHASERSILAASQSTGSDSKNSQPKSSCEGILMVFRLKAPLSHVGKSWKSEDFRVKLRCGTWNRFGCTSDSTVPSCSLACQAFRGRAAWRVFAAVPSIADLRIYFPED